MIQLTSTSQHPLQTITSQAEQSNALPCGADYGEHTEVCGGIFLVSSCQLLQLGGLATSVGCNVGSCTRKWLVSYTVDYREGDIL